MLVKESFARNILRLIVWYPLRWLIEAIPIKCGFAIFRMMGDIHYRLSKGKCDVVTRNLQSTFGDDLKGRELSDAVRGYFRNHYVNQLQIFIFPRLNRNNIEKYHTFEGLENLDAAFKKGKGCILIHPHFGPAQLPLCALGILGYPMMQLGLPTDEGLGFIGKKVAFRLRLKYEAKIPAQIVSANSFLRPIMNWLKDNGVLMMTADGAGGNKFIGKFIPVDFLGKPTLFPVGSAALATKMGVSLLPMFTTIQEDNTYKTVIHESINQDGSEQNSDSIEAHTTKFVQKMEGYMYKFPSLWHFWDELECRWAELNSSPIEKQPVLAVKNSRRQTNNGKI